jgi:hypothetical protein
MPVISVSGVPNETIWVRVWGYAGTTGTFNICVFDYYSNNISTYDDPSAEPTAGEQLDQPEVVKPTASGRDVAVMPRVTPNPVNDLLYLSMDQSNKTIVTAIVMTNLSGQQVIRREYVTNDNPHFTDQLDVTNLAPGIYVLQFITTAGIVSEKVSVVD